MAHTLPSLRYDYGALAPVLSAAALELHHGKHHKAYVDKLNDALKQAPSLAGLPVEELLKRVDEAPEAARKAIWNNGGGHANHSLMWDTLSPGGSKPSAAFKSRIDEAFGSIEEFKQRFEADAVGVFGSGWACLVAEPRNAKLSIVQLANQDTVYKSGRIPLLLCDVWEHAYYVDYQNRRPEWAKKFWDIVDWERVEAQLDRQQ
jgi:Fe-Mn family superoxide dismutase